METNPFFELSNMMGGDRSPGLTLLSGTVSNISPLIIEAAGLSLSGTALVVNDELISPKSGTISGSGSCSQGSATISGKCSIPAPLKTGDGVVLSTSDYQVFYVIFKAAKL